MGRITQRYYLPRMRRDVKAYIAGCEKCAKRKRPTKIKMAPMQIVRSGYQMERIALDILGELFWLSQITLPNGLNVSL